MKNPKLVEEYLDKYAVYADELPSKKLAIIRDDVKSILIWRGDERKAWYYQLRDNKSEVDELIEAYILIAVAD